MLKKLKRLFNISCLLGLHDEILVVSTTVIKTEDDLRNKLHNVDKWDVRVINTLPIPKNINDTLVITSCPQCGHINNQVYDYVMKRTKYYLRIIDRHTTAVENYMTYYNKIQRTVKEE